MNNNLTYTRCGDYKIPNLTEMGHWFYVRSLPIIANHLPQRPE